MAKQYNIKWRRKDKALLTRLENKVKKYVNAESIPEAATPLLESRESIKTRYDFNKYVGQLQSFLKTPGKTVRTDKGVVTTEWKLKDIDRKIAKINRERAKRLAEIEPSTYRGTMGAAREKNLMPKQKVNPTKASKLEWDKFVESVERQAARGYGEEIQRKYYENFIKSLETQYGQEAEPIIELAKQLTPAELEELYAQDPNMQAGFQYEKTDDEIKWKHTYDALANYIELKNET